MFFNWEAERRILRKIYVLVIDFDVLYDCDEMKISACPKCGSKSIQMGRIGDGVLFGIDSWKQVCRKCGYQGAPIIFVSETEYQKFLEELTGDKKQRKKEYRSPELSKEEKEIVDFLEEFEEKKSRGDKEAKKKDISAINDDETNVRWKIFLISIVISAFLVALTTPYLFSQFDVITAIAGIIGLFIALAFWGVLLMLLFVRFLYKETKNTLKRKDN